MSYSIEQYVQEVAKTKKDHETKTEAVFDWYLGLVGEAGELGETETPEEIIKEAGDCLWYLAAMHHELDLPMRDFPEVATFGDYEMDSILKEAESFKHHFFGKDTGRMEVIAKSLDDYYLALTNPLIQMGYRVEAIKIRLTGKDADKFDVYYRPVVQDFGLLDWAKNGQEAGTAGYGYRLEGICISVIPKVEVIVGPTAQPFKENSV